MSNRICRGKQQVRMTGKAEKRDSRCQSIDILHKTSNLVHCIAVTLPSHREPVRWKEAGLENRSDAWETIQSGALIGCFLFLVIRLSTWHAEGLLYTPLAPKCCNIYRWCGLYFINLINGFFFIRFVTCWSRINIICSHKQFVTFHRSFISSNFMTDSIKIYKMCANVNSNSEYPGNDLRYRDISRSVLFSFETVCLLLNLTLFFCW